ncbi:ABC transporter ATP-binding protein [Achromobacter sp. GG226]|uniref:ABC transporter ATP-binding protein n=1 Tax=Verticiella alkaliphila TaxID=2779529 RepID=UPI001C0C318D|nr:ABC transporter ATP-binding protein [Verticiella sp. GG226]MBU4610659.1 ABC transporter ATP-binding protein [Verticiella sp. GG226]
MRLPFLRRFATPPTGRLLPSGTTGAEPSPDTVTPGAPEPPLLRVRDLVTCFRTERGTVQAVDGISFDLAAGETLALVGESGSGKSVTALSLLRLIPSPPGRIESGQIHLEGEDLLALDEAGIRRVRGNKAAMIFQEPMSSLNPAMTAGMQVAEPLNLHRGMAWDDALARATELFREVRIPDAERRVNDFPHQFSGGMRQRVMIAMALACRPRLIIADEPTTALDVTVQAQVLDILKSLTEETRSALILITHDLGVVARYADRVAVMYAGRIVEIAPARQLYRAPRHPYTRGLMASVPRLDAHADERLVPIEGQPPDLANLPPGCAFAPRCRLAMPRCRTERPALEAVSADHFKACFADAHA